VDDGTRTHDGRDHNPGLYQLSYVHHRHRHEPSQINGLRSSKPFGKPSILLKIKGRRQLQTPQKGIRLPPRRAAKYIRTAANGNRVQASGRNPYSGCT
jgi:hypothetical protein